MVIPLLGVEVEVEDGFVLGMEEVPRFMFRFGSRPRRTSFFQPVRMENSFPTAATSPVRRHTIVGVPMAFMKSSYSHSVRWKHFSMNIRSSRPSDFVQARNDGRMDARDFAMHKVCWDENRFCRNAVRLWKPVV